MNFPNFAVLLLDFRDRPAVPGQHGIHHLDVLEIAQDWLRRRARFRAEVPLQITEPDHEFRNCRRARVQLQAQKLMRVHAVLVERQRLLPAEIGQRFQHLAFEPLHQFQRYIEEVAGAAGRVENARGAKALVEVMDDADRFLGLLFFLTCTCAHSCRSGSITVTTTRRST